MKHVFLILFLLLAAKLSAQNDCVDALVVCGDTNFNNIEVNGPGVQEVSSCGSAEFNSIWIKINIATSGILEFTITPQNSDINEDFDFYLYSYVTCNDRTIVRCSTTNPASAGLSNNTTGLNATESDVSEGPGSDGNSFLQYLDVTAGETYMLVVDRAFGNSNFSVTWAGTATFNQPPQFQLPTGVTSIDLSECDLDGIPDSSTPFDLTQNTPLIIGSQTDVAVTYHTSENDATLGVNKITNPSSFVNTSDPQTIYVRIENTVTECSNTSQFEISITKEVNLTATEFSICDDNVDGNEFNGRAIFNMQDVSAAVFPNFTSPGISVNYYRSQLDADTNSSPIPQFFNNTVAYQQQVFIKITNASCSKILPIDLKVNSFTNVVGATLVQCDFGLNQDGITLFNLSQADSFFTPSNPGVSVSYFLDNASVTNNIPLPNNYTNISNPQTIIAKLTNSITGCSVLYTLILSVNTATSQTLASLELCDIQENGLVSFDLSQVNVILTSVQTASFYPTLQDSLLQQNQIISLSSYANTTAYNDNLFVRINDALSGCSGISELPLQVNRLPDIEATDEAYICLNQPGYQAIIDAGLLDAQPYTFVWNFNGGLLPDTTYSIGAGQIGTYTVDIINAKGCKSTRTIAAVPSDIPVIESVTSQGTSIDGNPTTINLSPTNTDSYNYSIDNPDGPFQNSNQFNNVSCGTHTAYVTDNSGCGVASQTFEIIGIPIYFTPNGDGYEDTWNVRCATAHPNITISLFNRFGKLMKQISSGGSGWDGTFNGKGLPADDYWYIIKFDDGRIEKGHFSLKR